MKWLAKKVILSKLNGLLDRHKDDVAETKDTLKTWVSRLEKILGCFRGLLEKLDDGKIDADEIDQTVAAVETVVAEW